MTERLRPLLRRLSTLSIATRLVILFGAVALAMIAVSAYLGVKAERQVAALERLNAQLEEKRLLIELETAIGAYSGLLDARQSLVLNQDVSGLQPLRQRIADTRARIDGALTALSAYGSVEVLRSEIDALRDIHNQYLESTVLASFVPAAIAQRAFAQQREQVTERLAAFGRGGVFELDSAARDLDAISGDVRLTIGYALPATIAAACLALLALFLSVWTPLRRMIDTIARLDAPEATSTLPEDGPSEFRAVGRALDALRERLRAQRAAESEALRNAEKVRQFTAATVDVLWETGPDLRFNWAHGPEGGISEIRSHVLGRTRWETANADPDVEPNWAKHRDDMLKRRPIRGFDYYNREDGPMGGWWRITGVPLFDEDGVFLGYRGAATNITEQKRFEEQLRRSQNMETLGRLTSGVAHDFNNLLTVLSSNLEMLDARAALSQPFQGMLARCKRAATRGRRLTGQLLSLGQRQQVRPERLALAPFLAEFSDLVQRTLPTAITVDIQCDDAVPDLVVDAGLLHDALLNLVINARDAMPKGGALRIRTASRPSDAVAISVSDTGVGIDPSDRAHVFEPFFTTKEEGHGTGLGLSMVHDFVTRSGGRVELETAPGAGTTVTLILPRAADPSVAGPRDPALGDASRPATVVVVEADPDVRETLKTIIGFLGHRARAVAGAREATALVEAAEPPVEALLCDPARLGDEAGALSQALRARRSDALILLMADAALDPADKALFDGGALAVLRKPIVTEDLRGALGAVRRPEREREPNP